VVENGSGFDQMTGSCGHGSRKRRRIFGLAELLSISKRTLMYKVV
jgi:hypothetical protein